VLFNRMAHRVAGVVDSSGELTSLMRVDTGGEIDFPPRLVDSRCPFGFLAITGSKDAERRRYAGRSRPGHHRIEIGGELFAREMAMRINHLTLVPGEISWSNPTSTGLPPSGLAASTIPFDSMPINFAGFRLNTMTTVRPTNASGS